MKEDFKSSTIRAFDRHVDDYEQRKVDFIEKIFKEEMKSFIDAVKSTGGTKVLDVGSGPGRDGLYFKRAGLEPICIDLAKGMVEKCKEKGLKAYVMDFYNLKFSAGSFDGVWALFSLLHASKKDMPRLLEGIKRILKRGGIFYIAMYGGKGEGLREKDRYEEKRYFAYWGFEELEKVLQKFFSIRRKRIIKNTEKPPTLCFECERK